MPELFQLLIYGVLTIIAVAVVVYVTMRVMVNGWARRLIVGPDAAEGKRCICGYQLVGLPLPRCPECGRAIGFDKSFEELGVSPEEIRPRTPPPVD